MKIAIVTAFAAALAACSHAQPAPQAKAEPAADPAAAPPAAVVAPVEPRMEEPIAKSAPLPVVVPEGSIYFDFDESELKPESLDSLEKLGALLAAHPDLKLRIEGNCDERGTEEYNIALGQRRADAAKRYLIRLGAREQQISTVSYGETRPLAQGHDEEAWRENRRDDFLPDRATVPPQPDSTNQ